MKLNDDITVFNDIDIDYFNLESAKARLNLDNYIGADIGFKVNQFQTLIIVKLKLLEQINMETIRNWK